MIVILTEGQDDRDIVVGLMKHIYENALVEIPKDKSRKRVIVSDAQTLDVIECGGRDKLTAMLKTILDFPEYATIVILFDSDGDKSGMFTRMQTYIEDARLSRPKALDEFTDTYPRVLVKLIEPYDLESLVYPTLQGKTLNSIQACVDTFLACLDANNISPEPKNLFKTRIKALFAAKASDRGRIELTISGAVRENLFDFNHRNFSDLKLFLQQL